jgi:hypothetical protein
MKRFMHAIAVTEQTAELPELAAIFAEAVDEAADEGVDPASDPAVMLVGAFISFHTHSDINTVGGYHRLIAMCSERINERTLQ